MADKRFRAVGEVEDRSNQYHEGAAGIETLFVPPGKNKTKTPQKWKMLILIFLVAYVVGTVARLLLAPFLGSWPMFASNVVYASILVAAFYFGMPRLSVILRGWLYPS